MNKTKAIELILSATKAQPVVFTTGYACRIAKHIADRPGHFYMVGSMGLAACIGTGVAMQSRLPTLVVDGDGSLLMNPGALITLGAHPTLPVMHILLDDSSYASTGGQGTNSASVDFLGLAKSAGYARTHRVSDASELLDIVVMELEHLSSPVFIHCLLTSNDVPVPPRVELDLAEISNRFGRHIASVSR